MLALKVIILLKILARCCSLNFGQCEYVEGEFYDTDTLKINAIYLDKLDSKVIRTIEQTKHGYFSFAPKSFENGIPLVYRNLSQLIESQEMIGVNSAMRLGNDFVTNVNITSICDPDKLCRWPFSDQETKLVTGMASTSSYLIASFQDNENLNSSYIKTYKHTISLPLIITEHRNPNNFIKDFTWTGYQDKEEFYIFWGKTQSQGHWFYSKQTLNEDKYFDFNIIKHIYRPITHWLGCPQDMCIEGNVDAVEFDKTASNSMLIYREHYLFHLKDKKFEKITSLDNVIDSYVDVMIRGDKSYNWKITFKQKDSKTVMIMKNDLEGITLTLRTLQGKVDASFFDPRRKYLYVIIGNTILVYDLSVSNTPSIGEKNYNFKFYSFYNLTELFPGIWDDLDAAAYDPATDNILLFKGDYYVKYKLIYDTDNMTGVLSMPSRMTIGDLWSCDSSHYAKTMSSLFEVKDYEGFIEFFNKQKKRHLRIITSSEYDDTTKRSTTKNIWTPGLIAGVSVLIMMMIILVLIIFWYLCCDDEKQTRGMKMYVKNTSKNDKTRSTTFVSATSKSTKTKRTDKSSLINKSI